MDNVNVQDVVRLTLDACLIVIAAEMFEGPLAVVAEAVALPLLASLIMLLLWS